MSGILVFAEHEGGTFKKTAFELLGKAAELAAATGTNVTAAVLGDAPAAELGAFGAATVEVIDSLGSAGTWCVSWNAECAAVPVRDREVTETTGSHLFVVHRIDDSEQSVERRLNSVLTFDCRVAVQNLLQYLGIGNEAPALSNAAFEQPLGIDLVRMGRAHQVHRDVGVDQDQGPEP